jgi:LytS/YehU family sensor histidine kinase
VALLGMPLGLFVAAQVTECLFGVRVPGSDVDYRFGAFIGTLLAGLFFLWQMLADAKRAALGAELSRERAERHEVEALLASLTAQLNPHLLFNALNTVAALIQTRPAQAEETLLRLADLYRGLLAATRRHEHTLEDELAICRAYLDVEQARFSDRLRVEVDIDARLDPSRLQVPVLLLQPLVENALSHGLADRASGGVVQVVATATEHQLVLSVVDDGVGLGHSPRTGSGVGIANTRQRLRLRYGANAALELSSPAAGGTQAVLRLPLERLP